MFRRRADLLPRVLAPLLAALAGCAAERARDPFTATGEVIAMSGGDAGPSAACFTCHGLAGQGDEGSTPGLAGLSVGYLQKQLIDYADGRRTHPAMRSIAKALKAEDRRAVAAYFAALPARPTDEAAPGAPSVPGAGMLYHAGDPTRGLPACAACHGPAGEGIGPANPPLAGQPAAYLAEQLRLWRRSERRNDPLNVMLTISRRLTPAEVEAIAGYAAGLGRPGAPPSARPAASP